MSEEKIIEFLDTLAELKQARDDAERQYREHQSFVIDAMRELGSKTLTSGTHRFTAVIGERTIIDEDALRKAIGARRWTTISDRKLNRKKLEGALASGELDPIVLAQHSTVKRDEPHIRITDVSLP